MTSCPFVVQETCNIVVSDFSARFTPRCSCRAPFLKTLRSLGQSGRSFLRITHFLMCLKQIGVGLTQTCSFHIGNGQLVNPTHRRLVAVSAVVCFPTASVDSAAAAFAACRRSSVLTMPLPLSWVPGGSSFSHLH